MDFSKWLQTFGYAAGFLLIFSLEPFYEEALFSASISIIIILQKTANTYTEFISGTISDVGGEVMMFGMLLISFAFCSRQRAFYYMIVFCTFLYLNVLLKLIYRDTRPFWEDDDVLAIDCSNDFGNPSGHALSSTLILTSVMLDYLQFRGTTDSKFIQAPIAVTCVSFPLIVSFSRVYNGVHAINQVFFGWQLGIYLAFMLHYCFKEHIFNHVYNVIINGASISNRNFLSYLLMSGGVMASGMLSLMVVYEYNELTFTAPTEWATRYQSKCSEAPQDFNFDTYDTGGILAVFLGAYWGILSQSKAQWNTSESQGSSSIFRNLVRLIIISLMGLPFLAPEVIFEGIISNTYLQAMVFYQAPYYFYGFVMYAFTDVIMNVFSLFSFLDASAKVETISYSRIKSGALAIK